MLAGLLFAGIVIGLFVGSLIGDVFFGREFLWEGAIIGGLISVFIALLLAHKKNSAERQALEHRRARWD